MLLNSKTSHKSLIFLLSNCRPLSEIIEWGIPNQHIMFFHKKTKSVCFSYFCHQFCFKPFHKVINSDNRKTGTASPFRYKPNKINPPFAEWTGIRNIEKVVFELSPNVNTYRTFLQIVGHPFLRSASNILALKLFVLGTIPQCDCCARLRVSRGVHR